MRTTLSSPCSPCLRSSFAPRKLRAFARAIPLLPAPSPPRLLFSPLFSPTFLPVRNSWPLLLPPWNEVGMCKIVPRYALHHRVASSPPALFLPLAFFRPLLSPLYSPSFALLLERVSPGYCQYLPLCTHFSFFLFFLPFPLDPPRVFLPDHLIPFYALFLAYFSCSFFLTSLIFLDLFSFRSYFSLISFFLRIFLSLANSLLLFPPPPSRSIYIFPIFPGFFLLFVSTPVSLEESLYISLFWSK